MQAVHHFKRFDMFLLTVSAHFFVSLENLNTIAVKFIKRQQARLQ